MPLGCRSGTLAVNIPDPFFCRFLRRGFISLLHTTLCGRVKRKARLVCYVLASGAGRVAIGVRKDGHSSTLPARAIVQSNGGTPGPVRTPTPRSLSPRLGPGCGFRGFVGKGDGRFSHAMKRAMTGGPTGAFGPLFLCKPSNINGARLAGTVNAHVGRLCPRGEMLCMSTRLFRIRCASSIHAGRFGSFVDFCRAVSILVVSSVRRFTKMAGARGAFFRVFGRLRRGNGRLVLASSHTPMVLRNVRRHLLAHFG